MCRVRAIKTISIYLMLIACVCVRGQGVTFRVENGELVIARILHGGMIDQQGLLHVGDIIKEVNGKEVGNDPKVLQEMLKEASGSVVLKILPSYQEPHTARQVSVCLSVRLCDAGMRWLQKALMPRIYILGFWLCVPNVD